MGEEAAIAGIERVGVSASLGRTTTGSSVGWYAAGDELARVEPNGGECQSSMPTYIKVCHCERKSTETHGPALGPL